MEATTEAPAAPGLLYVPHPRSEKRSVSPITPSPSRKLRGVRLFRAISRRLGGSRSRQLSRSPSSGSDSDGSSSSDERRDAGYQSCSSGDQRSSSGSDTSSGGQTSPSAAGSESSGNTSSESSGHTSSIRRVIQSLSLNGRPKSKTSCPKKAPKKILRAPISYTYVKGLSGLPTQRVPKGYHCPCVYLPNPLHADFLGTTGLNR